MDKIKKISKYLVNILGIINVLFIKLQPIWNIPYLDKISETIAVIIAVIGTYLLGSKTIDTIALKTDEVKTDLFDDELENVTIYENTQNSTSGDLNE